LAAFFILNFAFFLDSLFVVRSYAARPAQESAMDNRINEIRGKIRALRVSMLQAEANMHEQINRDEDCSEIAGEMLVMRAAMSLLVQERDRLGDKEPILVNSFFIPRRASVPKPIAMRPMKRHLVPAKACPMRPSKY
jgi:hypothetical protein